MGSFKTIVLTDIPAANLADIVNTSIRQAGWEPPFVDDEHSTATANRNLSENVLGKMWHYRYRAVFRWVSMEEFAPMIQNAGQNSFLRITDGALVPINPTTIWTQADLLELRHGSALEIEIAEDSYPHTDYQCGERFNILIGAIWANSRRLVQSLNKRKEDKGARWAKHEELQEAGYVQGQGNDRSLIISSAGGSYLRLTEADTNRHALVCGPTGTGKTTGIFVPNLIERLGISAIVTEATGSKGRADLYQKTAGYRAAKGHAIYYFNPDDLKSDRINPLDRVHTYRDARRITEVIMQSTTLSTHRGDQTWDMAERLLLTSLILHSVGEREEGNCNLGYLLKLLNKGAEALGPILRESNIEEAREAYHGFLNNSTEAYRNLVAGGLITRLDLWKQPRIKALTEATDIDFEAMAEQLFTWYLATPADKPELKPLAALIFNIALDVIGNSQFKHGVMLMLDEFTNFGYVRGMPQKLSIIRHDKIPCVLGIQDYIQLEMLYQKEAPLFLSQPGTRVFFRPNDQQTAERISKGLGIVEERRRKITSSGQIHEERDRYPLLSLDELLNLNPAQLVAFTPRTRPVLTKAISWQDYIKETNETEYAPPERRTLEVDEQLTRLDKPKEQDKKKAEAPPAQTPEPVKLAALPPKVLQNPLLWSKEIRIEWAPQSGYQPKTYTPHSPLSDLNLIIYAFENKDTDARKYMTDTDYERVCSWIEARETSEVIDPVEGEESPKPVAKAQGHDPAVAAVTQNLETKEKPNQYEAQADDEFMGAWG
jgi:type IV secretion system protein VirD4